MMLKPHWCAVLVISSFSLATNSAQAAELGQFTGATDVGSPPRPGSAIFSAETQSYSITGGGANMWATSDEFHFVWTKANGDCSIAADIHWPTAGGDPHRKACLLLRQSLDADSAYADAVVHGDGLTSIQYRESRGDKTHEIQSNRTAPTRIRIEKRGDYVSMSVGDDASGLVPAGGIFRINLQDDFYIGLAVCAHDPQRLETAVFSNVVIEHGLSGTRTNRVESTLETISIASTDRRVIYHTTDLIEAPNWSPDGQALIYNGGGRLFRIPLKSATPQAIDTGTLTRLNNDHGISPDGQSLVISDQTVRGGSRIYTLPIAGGAPQLVTPNAPSYWHGWSPDGRTLVYCAEREGEFDIFSIPVEGGSETRLTTAEGLDDGPEYAADGQSIYFNSVRSGTMQIWKMNVDGTAQQQVTDDDFNNWFPHPSPDGKWIAFLSYKHDVVGHPANQDVQLRLMPVGGGPIQTLAKVFGGQGTINVPSWSPDSRNLAFVSYQPVYE